jgi:hypothetical protein
MIIRDEEGEGVIFTETGEGTAVGTGIRVGEGVGTEVKLVTRGENDGGGGCSAVTGGEPGERPGPLKRKIRASSIPAPTMLITRKGSRRIVCSSRIYGLNARKRITIRMIITIAIRIFIHGIPSGVLPVFSRRDTVLYPPPVAVAVPPLLYDIPTPGAGFFFHESNPAHWWTGGSRHSGQNVPPQCWQVNGRVHSFPQ